MAVFSVSGMTCAACAGSVDKAMKRLPPSTPPPSASYGAAHRNGLNGLKFRAFLFLIWFQSTTV